jgi:hypothetical protein
MSGWFVYEHLRPTYRDTTEPRVRVTKCWADGGAGTGRSLQSEEPTKTVSGFGGRPFLPQGEFSSLPAAGRCTTGHSVQVPQR